MSIVWSCCHPIHHSRIVTCDNSEQIHSLWLQIENKFLSCLCGAVTLSHGLCSCATLGMTCIFPKSESSLCLFIFPVIQSMMSIENRANEKKMQRTHDSTKGFRFIQSQLHTTTVFTIIENRELKINRHPIGYTLHSNTHTHVSLNNNNNKISNTRCDFD